MSTPASDPLAQPGTGPAPARPAVHVGLVVVQLAFGSLAVEGKVAMGPGFGVPPSALAMARILGAALLFIAAHLALRTPRVRAAGDMLRLALLALFGVVLNQALFLAGLQRTSPISATLLVATIPVFTAALSAITGADRLTRRGALGIALALLGIATLAGFTLPRWGDALVLLNSASYAIYLVSAKPLIARYGTITVIAWVFGCGALLFAPFGATVLVRAAGSWPSATLALVAFIVLVPTVLAYSVNAWALGRATPTLVTIYVYLQPLFVAALAWVQLGQPLVLRTAVAGLLILTGVGLVVTASRRRARLSPAKPS